jgi:hypothetical protein
MMGASAFGPLLFGFPIFSVRAFGGASNAICFSNGADFLVGELAAHLFHLLFASEDLSIDEGFQGWLSMVMLSSSMVTGLVVILLK